MTKLAYWLKQHNIRRNAFARAINVEPSTVTRLCKGTLWPSRDVAARIREATNGAITADDFLPQDEPEAAA